MSSILENAVDSIAVGVEDLSSKDARRLVSAARNFHAGVLLLLKHRLSMLSSGDEEALIKAKVLPTIGPGGRVIWKGAGGRTVDVQQIKERFKSLKISVAWKPIDELTDYRNDVEHYHIEVKPSTVRQYITDCFVVVQAFIRDEIKGEPRKVLGKQTWERLVEEEKVYRAEETVCQGAMKGLVWPNKTAKAWALGGRCSNCESALIRPKGKAMKAAKDSRFECSVCGTSWDYDEFISEVVRPEEDARHILDGGGVSLGICPECGNATYDAGTEQCVSCGESGPHECERCGNTIPVEELSWEEGKLCGWCQHMSQKDD